jgi:hypothetical protein
MVEARGPDSAAALRHAEMRRSTRSMVRDDDDDMMGGGDRV